jgi:pimeloyl-ACP methyl ester carboxylesterase
MSKSPIDVLLLAVLAFLLGAFLALPAVAQDTSDQQCRALTRRDFSRTQDAPFTLTGASVMTQNVNRPFCELDGYIIPEISFKMRLPIVGWNGRFILLGSGGWANRKSDFLCDDPLSRGYACIMGDGGHQYNDGLWMQSNPQTKIDWGYRATHVVALAGKTLVQALYLRPPVMSLMLGVSTGGYQGLVEAQRFPWDFSGIIAIAPDIDEGDLSMRTAWIANHLLDENGGPLFTKSDLQILHAGALKACDDSDNIRDGIIGDPIACKFDPRTVECGSRRSTNCLAKPQVDAAMAIYGGPTTSAGVSISTGGPLPGSEMEWPDALEDVSFAENFFRFALTESPLDGFSARKFNYDEDYKRLGLAGTFLSSDPDLRRFRQAGGKLLIVQGGNDVTEQVRSEIDYFEMVERVMGGAEETRGFVRLFLVPGMNHGSGGDGAFAIDYLSAMERWVADQAAPDVLVGAHVPEWANGSAGIRAGLTAPRAGMQVTFKRPIYPYPLHAVYNGHGDATDYRSFHPAPVK